MQAQLENLTSTPSFEEFNPCVIPYQYQVIDDIENKFDYGLGTHEVLLSGSVGSAKSLLLAHLAVKHCVSFPGARVLLGRRALPDLKDTIYLKIIEHLQGSFIEGTHYTKADNLARIKFANGSEIMSRSWADKNYKKMRSIELSMAVFEELTENNDKDKEAYDEVKFRIGRLPHVPQNLFISATNPDSPSHWVYDYFELGKQTRKPTKHVYYSKTEDNPFLPSSYINQIKEDSDPMMYQRMGLGRWIEIRKEVIYSEFGDHNCSDDDYQVDPFFPIHISWDFNIGIGKPLSLCLFQYIDNCFHFFDEVVIDGADTDESCGELAARGLLDHPTTYIVNGDATGERKSTTSKRSDYDIIKKFMANHLNSRGDKLDYRMGVPRSNPPVRARHNIVNAYCKNALGQVRLMVYNKCKTIKKGMRLTALKSGGSYIEDDSKDFQHVTTALGYGVCWVDKENKKGRSRQSRSVNLR